MQSKSSTRKWNWKHLSLWFTERILPPFSFIIELYILADTSFLFYYESSKERTKLIHQRRNRSWKYACWANLTVLQSERLITDQVREQSNEMYCNKGITFAIPVWRNTNDEDGGNGEGKDGSHKTGGQLFVAYSVLLLSLFYLFIVIPSVATKSGYFMMFYAQSPVFQIFTKRPTEQEREKCLFSIWKMSLFKISYFTCLSLLH